TAPARARRAGAIATTRIFPPITATTPPCKQLGRRFGPVVAWARVPGADYESCRCLRSEAGSAWTEFPERNPWGDASFDARRTGGGEEARASSFFCPASWPLPTPRAVGIRPPPDAAP